MGGTHPKKGPCSLPSFLMVRSKFLAARGFIGAQGSAGGMARTVNAVLVEPDPWGLTPFTHQPKPLSVLGHSPAAAETPPAPGPNQASNSKGSLAKPDLCATCHGGKKPEASQGNGLPLLFSLVCFPECIFSQNNLIVWIFFVDHSIFVDEHYTDIF